MFEYQKCQKDKIDKRDNEQPTVMSGPSQVMTSSDSILDTKIQTYQAHQQTTSAIQPKPTNKFGNDV